MTTFERKVVILVTNNARRDTLAIPTEGQEVQLNPILNNWRGLNLNRLNPNRNRNRNRNRNL